MGVKVNAKQLGEVFCKIANTNFDLREAGDTRMYPVLIIGDKELASGGVALRTRRGELFDRVELNTLVERLAQEKEERLIESSYDRESK